MHPYPVALLAILVFGAGAELASGQTPAAPPAPPPAAATSSASQPPAAPTNASAESSRPVSPDVAAMLAVSMPKYDPPKPVPPPKPEDEYPDLRDVEKPKNGIVRLPQYLVHAPRPTVFREWDLYSKEGLAQLALQRYQGLAVVPFAGLNLPIAAQMYNEDERLQNMADLDQTANAMAKGGDKGESEYIKKMSQDTYARGFDWGGIIPKDNQPTDTH